MGLEYITQPQVFLAPITAANVFIGVTENYPLITSYQYWTSSAPFDSDVFPIPGTWLMMEEPASFVVSVGNVIQSPQVYTIDRSNRKLIFSSAVPSGVEVAATQLATAAPSSISYAYFKSLSASITDLSIIDTAQIPKLENISLTSTNALIQNLTATTATVSSLLLTNLSINTITGDVTFLGNLSGNKTIINSNIITNQLTSTNAVFTNTLSISSDVETQTVTKLLSVQGDLDVDGKIIIGYANIPVLSATTTNLLNASAVNFNADNIILTPSSTPLVYLPNVTTSLTTAASGVNEYNGRVFLSTPIRSKGISPSFFYLRNNRIITLPNSTAHTNWLSAGISLAANTQYDFEGEIVFSRTMTTNSHQEQLIFGGTAIYENFAYTAVRSPDTATASTPWISINSTTSLATNISPAFTTAQTIGGIVKVSGTFGIAIGGEGTFEPKLAFSAAPGGTGSITRSYLRIFPVGYLNANTTVGNWFAV